MPPSFCFVGRHLSSSSCRAHVEEATRLRYDATSSPVLRTGSGFGIEALGVSASQCRWLCLGGCFQAAMKWRVESSRFLEGSLFDRPRGMGPSAYTDCGLFRSRPLLESISWSNGSGLSGGRNCGEQGRFPGHFVRSRFEGDSKDTILARQIEALGTLLFPTI